nr:Fem-1b [Sinonovacula constricta]
MATAVSVEKLELLKKDVFRSASNGHAISLFALLWNQDQETVVKKVLSHRTEEEGQNTTPLIIAARNGHDKVVRILLTNFPVDIEETGTVKFDGYCIEGASPLWCAAGAGHFNIVTLLIEHGANVNHATSTNSTPLRAACFDGRLDIVLYLLQHKADISIANKYRNTCLMISCYKGHNDVVTSLLEYGADPDAKAHCGATALHFSAECGHVDIVKMLLDHGATMVQNDNGMSPLMVAAEGGQASVVDYLTSLPSVRREERIDAFELLGTAFANDRENYDIHKAYEYLMKGMKERYKDPDNVIDKVLHEPVPAYESRIECKTVKDLEMIEENFNTLHMEALAIRERILGSHNPDVPHPVIFRGAVFADSRRFDRCISLWLYALQLRHNNNRSISKDLLRFSQVFAQMVQLGVFPEFSEILKVFEYGTLELIRDQQKIAAAVDDTAGMMETYEENIHSCIYLLVIMLKLSLRPVQYQALLRAVYKFQQTKLSLRNGYTPLHMSTDSATIVDDFHVNDVVKFPNGGLCKLLILGGMDVNCQDNQGNTPLHVIVKYNNPVSDFDNLHACMISLLSNGAHQDIRNKDGKTAISAAMTGVADVILRTNMTINLKCFAAQVIRKHDIPYIGHIPKTLERFVELH